MANHVARGHDYAVANPSVFSSIVRGVVNSQFSGNVRAASIRSGIPYNSLKRYMLGGVSSIRLDSLERIHRFVGRRHWEALERALLSPQARERLSNFDTWIVYESEFAASGVRAALENVGRVSRISVKQSLRWSRESFVALNRAHEAKNLVLAFRQRFPDLWRPLDDCLKRRGHFNPRGQLANLRIVSPLLCRRESGGVERGAEELSEKELVRFLKAGVARETILLDRAPDLARASDTRDHGPRARTTRSAKSV